MILLFSALLQFDIMSLLYSARQISVWFLVALLGLQVVTQLLINIQWHQIAKFANTRISFWDMIYLNSKGAVVDSITPGVKIGGEITRTLQIKRILCCSVGQAAALVAVQKTFSLGVFFFISLFAAAYLTVRGSFVQFYHLQILVYGVMVAFVALFFSIIIMPHRIIEYLQPKEITRFRWAGKLKVFLLSLLEQVCFIRKSSKAWVIPLSLSVLIWLLYPAKIYILATQISPGVNVIYLGAIAFVAYMAAILPVFPGGLGGFEGTMSAMLFAVGFNLTDAVVITVLFRFVTFWFVMILSIIFIAFYKFKYAKGDLLSAKG